MDFPTPFDLTSHAREEMREDGYTEKEIAEALTKGNVIKSHGDTGRGPSALILHWITETGRPIHVVAAPKSTRTVWSRFTTPA